MKLQALALGGESAPPTEKAVLDELASLGVELLVGLAPGAPVVLLGAPAEPSLVTKLRLQGHRRVVVIGHGEQAWELLSAGASDVIDCVPGTAVALVARLERWATIDALVASDLVRNNLIGSSGPWVAALEQLVEASRFSSKPVLITGESGTGKEMAARLVHTLDPRPQKGQLVILDCSTIVPSLSGSELFGHSKGAFTGAAAGRRGALALADGGTLFLDEVGELSSSLQTELLRAVQEGTYKPVGSDHWERAQFRLVCATNRDILAMQGANAFRADLYYRLAAISVHLPSLAERVEDVPLLARHFLTHEEGASVAELAPAVEAFLVEREYPGNVRDLKQLMARMACRHAGPGPLTPGDIPLSERPTSHVTGGWHQDPALAAAVSKAVVAGAELRPLKEAVADLAVAAALRADAGSVALAARRLSVSDRAIQLRLASHRSGDAVVVPLGREKDDDGEPLAQSYSEFGAAKVSVNGRNG
jgi:transcriptional regulator with GAF, ATPase, and Fis domain